MTVRKSVTFWVGVFVKRWPGIAYLLAVSILWNIKMFFKRITGQFSKTQVALHSLQRRLDNYVGIKTDVIQERMLGRFELKTGPLLYENLSESCRNELTTIGREELETVIDNLESFQQCEELFFGNRSPVGLWGDFKELPTEAFATLYTGRNRVLIDRLIPKVNNIVNRSPESLKRWRAKWANYQNFWSYHPLVLLLCPHLGFSIRCRQYLALILLNWGCAPPDDNTEAARMLRSCAASVGVGRDSKTIACRYPENIKAYGTLSEKLSPLRLAMASFWRDAPADRGIESQILQYLQKQGYTLFTPCEESDLHPWKDFFNSQLNDLMLIRGNYDHVFSAAEDLLIAIVEPLLTEENSDPHKAALYAALKEKQSECKKLDTRNPTEEKTASCVPFRNNSRCETALAKYQEAAGKIRWRR